MKESFWRISSIVFLTILVVVVASWAWANQQYAEKKTSAGSGGGDVIVESNKQRYWISGGVTKGTDHDKIILWDTWDVENTKQVWYMKDPQSERPKWVKCPFDKR